MLNKRDGKELIKIAKSAISSVFLKKEQVIDCKVKEKFKEKQGVFVTLKINDKLRGCIGFVEGVFPLYEAVTNAARSAAFSDPRFMPLTEGEFKDTKIEVSVLTKPELIEAEKPEDYLDKVKVGEVGLIIKSRLGSGLLLPQVPVEWNWNVKEFLEHTCQKAGLDKDAWKYPNNKVYKFQAQIFGEG